MTSNFRAFFDKLKGMAKAIPFFLEKALIIDTICGDRRAIVPPL